VGEALGHGDGRAADGPLFVRDIAELIYWLVAVWRKFGAHGLYAVRRGWGQKRSPVLLTGGFR